MTSKAKNLAEDCDTIVETVSWSETSFKISTWIHNDRRVIRSKSYGPEFTNL